MSARLRVGDYPIGTKVYSTIGGHWTRVAAGWQASGGDIFPHYGADAFEVEFPADVEALNAIISECADACGAFVAPDASLEFKRLLPGEITLAIGKARAMPPIVGELGTINGFTITETKKR